MGDVWHFLLREPKPKASRSCDLRRGCSQPAKGPAHHIGACLVFRAVANLSQDQFPDRFEVSAKQEKICVKRLVERGGIQQSRLDCNRSWVNWCTPVYAEPQFGAPRMLPLSPFTLANVEAPNKQELLPPPLPLCLDGMLRPWSGSMGTASSGV